MNVFRTKNNGFASYLAYVNGQHLFQGCVGDGDAYWYSFLDEGDVPCQQLEDEYFDPKGASVQDARLLLERARFIRGAFLKARQTRQKTENEL